MVCNLCSFGNRVKKRSFTGSGLQWNNQEKAAVLVKVFWSDLEEFVSRQTIYPPPMFCNKIRDTVKVEILMGIIFIQCLIQKVCGDLILLFPK